MNGFQLHNLKHSSASSVNTWIGSKEKWVRQKLFKEPFFSNPAMERGKAVESAAMDILCGLPTEDSLTRAIRKYNKATLMNNSPHVDPERLNIEPMVKQAVHALRDYGVPDVLPNGEQHKITINCVTPEWTLPVIGYLDTVYHKNKFVIDFKSTTKLPENMSADHRRQSSIYQLAMPDYDVVFLYISVDGTVTFPSENVPETMAQIKEALIEQEAFLSSSPDKNVLLAAVAKEVIADAQNNQ